MNDQKMNMRYGVCTSCNQSCNLNTHVCIPSGGIYQPQTLAGKVEMLSELQLMKPAELKVLIPITLLIDLYAEVAMIGRKDLMDAIKKAFNNE